MLRNVWRRVLPLRSSRRLTALVAVFVMLGAVCISSARTPTVSAQCVGCFGNGIGINNGIGFNNGFGFNGLYGNGLYGNGLYSNGLYGNGVYGNGLYGNGLYGNGLYGNGLYGNGLYGNGVSGNGLYGNGIYGNGLYGNSIYSNSYIGNVGVNYQPTYPLVHPYAVSGQYCTDKTGGRVWVNTDAPTEGLTCGGSSGGGSPASSGSSSSSTQAAPPNATAAVTAPAPAAVSAAVLVAQNATLGPILTDPSGRTVYVFKNDAPGTSNCNGNCATTWPPLQPPSGTLSAGAGASGALAAITRADGNQQVTYKGMPLYLYSQDTAPGDTKGQGIGGVWSAATP